MDRAYLEHLRVRAREERSLAEAERDDAQAALHRKLADAYEAVIRSYGRLYPTGRGAPPSEPEKPDQG